jgi:hypothetical protein
MLSRVICWSVLCAGVLLSLPQGASAAGFKVKAVLPADPGSRSVALADFNHDGKLDLAEVGYLASNVSVWMGTGEGSFHPPVRYSVGKQPFGVSIADLNLDGNPDLVVANELDDTISVLLGNGDGTFQLQLVFAVGDGPTATAVGDFNRDGIPDVVVACLGVAVLLGNGDGTFQPATFPSSSYANSVAVADFNRDGNLDIAMGFGAVQEGRVQMLLGHGNGTFEAGAHYSLGAGTEPLSIAVGDLNHDRKLDLVASTFPGSLVAVLLGHGDGTFRQAVFYGSFNHLTTSVVMADFNRDGNPDVAAAIFTNPSFVSVFNGNGDGTLQPPVSYNARGNEGQGIAAGDLNGDGSPDLVMANTADEDVSVLLNTGGTFLKTSSSLNPSHVGESVTFTTTVKQSVPGTGVPTGTVTFKDGSTALGTVSLTSGVATFTTSSLSAGSHNIVASYSGDANFNRNNSKPLTQVVEP